MEVHNLCVIVTEYLYGNIICCHWLCGDPKTKQNITPKNKQVNKPNEPSVVHW